jgi:hypothetical protein
MLTPSSLPLSYCHGDCDVKKTQIIALYYDCESFMYMFTLYNMQQTSLQSLCICAAVFPFLKCLYLMAYSQPHHHSSGWLSQLNYGLSIVLSFSDRVTASTPWH